MNKKIPIRTFVCSLILLFFSDVQLHAAATSPSGITFSSMYRKKGPTINYSQSVLLGCATPPLSQNFSLSSSSDEGTHLPEPHNQQTFAQKFNLSPSSNEAESFTEVIAPPNSPQTYLKRFMLSEEISEDGPPPYPSDLKEENKKLRKANQQLTQAIYELEQKLTLRKTQYKKIINDNKKLRYQLHTSYRTITILKNLYAYKSKELELTKNIFTLKAHLNQSESLLHASLSHKKETEIIKSIIQYIYQEDELVDLQTSLRTKQQELAKVKQKIEHLDYLYQQLYSS